MAESESLTIEQTNVLRAKLGLKPLNVGTTEVEGHAIGDISTALTSEQQEQQAVLNAKNRREAQEKLEESARIRNRLQKSKEKIERARLLQGKTLADPDSDEEEDTLTWIKRQKSALKVVENPAVKLLKTPNTNEADHLQGLHVGHDLCAFEEGGDGIILTLEDRGVLEEEEADELINIDLAEKQRLEEKLNSKKRKSAYTAYEDEEIDETTGTKKILAKYEHEPDAAPRKKVGFTISDLSRTTQEADHSEAPAKKRIFTSLDSIDLSGTPETTVKESDYMDAVPVKIKKPKRKKKNTMQRVRSSEQDNDGDIEIYSRTVDNDVNFIDDEDVQASLARQRRLANQKRRIQTPEAIANSLLQEQSQETKKENLSNDVDGLVLDETSEFTRGLRNNASVRVSHHSESASQMRSVSEFDNLRDVDEDNKPEEGELDPNVPSIPLTTTGLAEESTLSSGLGSVLGMLRQKGVLAADTEKEKRIQEREAWILKNREAQTAIDNERKRVKELAQNDPVVRNMSIRERDAWNHQQNLKLSQMEAGLHASRFKNYKPNVEIKHIDEFGREMTPKEAFKHMSHQFHGVESGSMKTEKRLKKLEEERENRRKKLF